MTSSTRCQLGTCHFDADLVPELKVICLFIYKPLVYRLHGVATDLCICLRGFQNKDLSGC